MSVCVVLVGETVPSVGVTVMLTVWSANIVSVGVGVGSSESFVGSAVGVTDNISSSSDSGGGALIASNFEYVLPAAFVLRGAIDEAFPDVVSESSTLLM